MTRTERPSPSDAGATADAAPATPTSGEPPAELADLSVLRSNVRAPIDHLECFPAPEACTRVRFTTDEVTSVCPITGQPDFSSVEIDYRPDELCIESKSLKLYLWSFRDRPVFAEALAAEIATEVQRTAGPRQVRVTVTQGIRGGIVNESTAELP